MNIMYLSYTLLVVYWSVMYKFGDIINRFVAHYYHTVKLKFIVKYNLRRNKRQNNYGSLYIRIIHFISIGTILLT